MTRALVKAASALALVLSFNFTVVLPAMADDSLDPPSTTTVAEPAPFCKIVEMTPEPKEKPDQAAADTAAKPDAPPPAAKPDIVLREELNATCADGKIKFAITVGTRPLPGRLYGWKIGDVIPIHLQFTVAKDAAINLDPLVQGKLAITKEFKQSFELAGKPIIRKGTAGEDTVYDVMLEVRQFEVVPYIRFALELPYAVKFAPDKTPEWEAFSTPPYILLQNIDGGYEVKRPMTPGDANPIHPRAPWVVPVGTIIIVLLFLSWPAIVGLRYVNRVRPRKHISREAAAWLAMHRVMKSGKEIGFGTPHYTRIADVLRKYFSVDYSGLEGMTLSEINALPDEPRANLIKSAFRKLDRALVEGKPLTAAENDQLASEVDSLIARPWTM